MENKTGKKVMILEQFVYKESATLIKDIVGSGKIGELIFFERILHVKLEQKKQEELSYGNTVWRIRPEFMLGIFFDAAVHDLSELAMIFGNPVSVYASGSKYREGYGPYDHLAVLFEYKDKLRGIFSFSSLLGGSRNRFDIWGTGGQVYNENNTVFAEYGSGNKERFDIRQEDVHMDMWIEIHEYLLGNKNPYFTTSVAINDIKVIEAVEKSLKGSCKIKVE
jgi:predicted dehydrogenase